MSWACGKCDREKRKIKGDIIPEHFRTCPKRKSMTTNETLIEKAKSIWDMVDDGGSVEDIAEFLQAKEGEMKEKIKSKKKYWHIRFEGISDPVISAERKKFNEEVSELINSVLDDLLSNLSEK